MLNNQSILSTIKDEIESRGVEDNTSDIVYYALSLVTESAYTIAEAVTIAIEESLS